MAIAVRPEQGTVPPRQEISDYSTVSPDQFRWQLNGYEQEAGIKQMLRKGALEVVAAWRPDFDALTPLTPVQERFASRVRTITKSNDLRLVSYGPGPFSQIRGAVLEETIEQLEVKLEGIRDRYREHKDEPDSTFWLYREPLGTFPAAMLYRADLEAQIRQEQEEAAKQAAIERAKLS